MPYFCRKIGTMKQLWMLLTTALLLWGCGSTTENKPAYCLQGAWVLRHLQYPMGAEYDFSLEGSGTLCLIYNQDSTLYECKIATTSSGLVIMPKAKSSITLIDKGRGEWLYLEGKDPHPLTVSDTLITIQRNGILYSYTRDDDLYQEWGADICHLIANEVERSGAGSNNYVLSARERQQESYIQWLVMTIALVIIIAITNYIVYQRRRRQMQLQLQQIQEVQEQRPASVRQAIESVETAYFASDEYQALQHRIATRQRLKEEDWQNIESQIRKVYPGFSSQLYNLHPMSELEYQVCLLIKLRMAPSDIATVLARDASTISTVRSRLYKKVFGQKGGTKEWDEFILSIDT